MAKPRRRWKLSKPSTDDCLFFAGLVLLGAGGSMVWLPLGPIVDGALLVLLVVPGPEMVRAVTLVCGYANVYGILHAERDDPRNGRHRLRVLPGALDALARRCPEVLANVAHEGESWARTLDGSLRVWTDSYGLAFLARPDATPLGRKVIEMVRSGRWSGSSIRYSHAAGHWTDESAGQVWNVEDAEVLRDVCICPAGANPKARVVVISDRSERDAALAKIRTGDWSTAPARAAAVPRSVVDVAVRRRESLAAITR